ncbi:MAG: DEAD/DEAH box helicase [Chloroflexia bacterium]
MRTSPPSRGTSGYEPCCYGGVAMGPQFTGLLVVGTPGRILDHPRGTLRLDDVRYLVLDEADTMLDMGFAPDVQRILSHTPEDRQTALFSVSMPTAIAASSTDICAIRSGSPSSRIRTVDTVEQVYYHVADRRPGPARAD